MKNIIEKLRIWQLWLIPLLFIAAAGTLMSILIAVEGVDEKIAQKKPSRRKENMIAQMQTKNTIQANNNIARDEYMKKIANQPTANADDDKDSVTRRALTRANISSIVQALKSPSISSNDVAKEMLIKSLKESPDIAVEVLSEEYNSNLPPDTRKVITEAMSAISAEGRDVGDPTRTRSERRGEVKVKK